MSYTYQMPRPPLPPRDRRSAKIELRVRPALRRALERLALRREVSLSRVAETLLESGVAAAETERKRKGRTNR